MRTISIFSLTAAFALAACGGDADRNGDGTVSTEEAASEVAGATLPEPGLYKASVEIEEMTLPGMPAGMADQMKASTAAAMAVETCLTEADRADMVKNMAPAADGCKYDKYELSGGRIDAQMTCTTPDGGTAVTTMKGTVSSTGVDMVMENTQKGGAQEAGSHMKMRMKNTRVGDCPA